MTNPNKPQPEPFITNPELFELQSSLCPGKAQGLNRHNSRRIIFALQDARHEKKSLRAALDVAVEALRDCVAATNRCEEDPGRLVWELHDHCLAAIERIMGKGDIAPEKRCAGGETPPSPEPTQPDIAQARADGLALRDEIVCRQKAPTPEPEPVDALAIASLDCVSQQDRIAELEAENERLRKSREPLIRTMQRADERAENAERERDGARLILSRVKHLADARGGIDPGLSWTVDKSNAVGNPEAPLREQFDEAMEALAAKGEEIERLRIKNQVFEQLEQIKLRGDDKEMQNTISDLRQQLAEARELLREAEECLPYGKQMPQLRARIAKVLGKGGE